MEPIETPVYTPEEQAALDRYEGKEPNTLADYNPDGTPKEPEAILGKFKSQEDLVKAYQELEKKLGQPKTTEEPKGEPKTSEEPKEVPEEAKGLLSSNDFDNFSKEYNESGSLSEDTYKALEAKGLSKDIVDNYIEGQKSLAESKAQKLLDYVGGTEEYNSLVAWAKLNYTQEQAEAFDNALYSGNESKVQEQIDLLNYRMSKTVVNRVSGTSSSGTSGLKPFTDKGDWQKAVSNSLYGRDAKYTSMVDGRYLRSLEAKTL